MCYDLARVRGRCDVETIGHHYIAEASGCSPNVIGKVESVEQILVRAAEVAGVQVWSISFHRFSPNGVSGVVVISESHMSVHTWPEYGYAAVDIFTCGGSAKPEKAVEWALKEFGATNVHITEVTRGLEEGDKVFFHSIVTWEEELLKRAVNGQRAPRRSGQRRRAASSTGSRRRRTAAKPKE
jgi:S-adenosylmethionine decarboxylase